MLVKINNFLQALIDLEGTPYARLDCQGLIKQAMRNCGADVFWIGTNDMWRNKTHGNNAISGYDNVPVGALLFVVKKDGKEPSYYHDGVNASHVGVKIDDNRCIHSSKGGVQIVKIEMPGWTHYAYLNGVVYQRGGDVDSLPVELIIKIKQKVRELYELLECGKTDD